MALNYDREKISDGIYLTSITDKRFKTNYLTINLITNLSKDTASGNALLTLLLSRSNSDYPTITEFNKKLASLYGAGVHSSCTKFGDSQVVTISASCIENSYTFEKEDITSELTNVLLKCLVSPYTVDGKFDEKDFALKKQELLDEIDADINDKRTYAIIRSAKTIFEGEPCSITAKGEKSIAETLTSEEVYNQYKNLLKTAQIEIFFTGGGDSSSSKNEILKCFKNLDRSFKNNYSSNKSKLKSTARNVEEKLDISQSKMVMAFKTSYTEIPVMKLLNSIYGGTAFSKLFINVREKLSLCYYCACGYEDKKGVLYVDSGVEKENIEKAKDEIINQLNEIKKGEITDEEFENSKLSLINSYKTVTDSPYSIASWYLQQSYRNSSNSPEDEIENIKAITKEQVISAANTLELDTIYVLTSNGKGGNEDE